MSDMSFEPIQPIHLHIGPVTVSRSVVWFCAGLLAWPLAFLAIAAALAWTP